MMTTQIMVHEMPQISQRIIQRLPGGPGLPPLPLIQLVRSLHENGLMMLAQLHENHFLTN
jgi:hypothetical protein